MTAPDEATRRQHMAARPDASTWLSANAGSGKTRVLTDRVARLLLGHVQPQHILCLTYTKAAASEMQNRLFKGLGAWAMLPDDPLRDALLALGYSGPMTTTDLRRARTLFARAIETPGGLKIQTIHSFCASVLRRFPLEAGVSPQFTEIEDRAAELLRADILDQMAEGPEADLLARFGAYSGYDIGSTLRSIVSGTWEFGVQSPEAAHALFDLPPGTSRESVVAGAFAPGDAQLLADLIPALQAGSKTDISAAKKLAGIDTLDEAAISTLKSVFVTGSGQNAGTPKVGTFPTKGTREANEHLMPALNDWMTRIADAVQQLRALDAAEATLALHQFGAEFSKRYRTAKQARAWLDFDDLIERARMLLSDSAVAAWVLYRLDGGIDHILVDEAQDTSPTQWDVIRKLAEEFSSGEGARGGTERTIFVVGDKKQSIYSFQGADPKAFDAVEAEFHRKLSEAGSHLNALTLDYSFRSSPAVLRLVDAVFASDLAHGFDAGGHHIAFHDIMPGRVDLWPMVPEPEKPEELPWNAPIDRPSPTHQNATLANAIAAEIKRLIDAGTPIPDGAGTRRVRPRDFLILVRTRTGIFHDIIRACKAANLPIAGADRLKVAAELAVRDLRALLSFLATPEDDLSLATALRSPLFGWSEQDLFSLAHHRGDSYLWQALRNDDAHANTVAILQDMRDQNDFLRPYDLIERMLTRHAGRMRILARLGTEAEDGIDALLSQALAYERSAIPSLTGFLTWLETDDLEIKRQIDSASDQIRVMTVHGAKGLEAPIVILPETGRRQISIKNPVIDMDGHPVWKMNSGDQPEAMQARIEEMKQAQEAEQLRLLYVALTRAEKWLIVAGAGKLSADGPDWWRLVADGLSRSGAMEHDTPVGSGLRLSHGVWPDQVDTPAHSEDTAVPPPTLNPVFTRSAPTRTQTPLPISPSGLGGEKALPGEGRADATAYGTLVHVLLERLPNTPVASRNSLAQRIAKTHDLPPEAAAEAIAEVGRVLDNPDLAHVFAPGTLAEVPFAVPLDNRILRGSIDRLIVDENRVLVVDHKSNSIVPDRPALVPEGLLRQLGAYAHAVEQIYPGRRIDLAFLWTSAAQLMTVDHDIVFDAFARRTLS